MGYFAFFWIFHHKKDTRIPDCIQKQAISMVVHYNHIIDGKYIHVFINSINCCLMSSFYGKTLYDALFWAELCSRKFIC